MISFSNELMILNFMYQYVYKKKIYLQLIRFFKFYLLKYTCNQI